MGWVFKVLIETEEEKPGKHEWPEGSLRPRGGGGECPPASIKIVTAVRQGPPAILG